ncbi:MAG: arsenate reductase ArsC [Bryobacteraceae bacterium]
MERRKVLFVCIGNSCRSQMAEGFARCHGADIVEPFSAGLAPAMSIASETRKVMLEKDVDLGEQFPKDLYLVRPELMDTVINLSGMILPDGPWKDLRNWPVPDPIGKPEKFHRQVRDDVEARVMELLFELRQRGQTGAPEVRPPARVRFGRTRT